MFLKVENVSKNFGGLKALSHIDMVVEEGKITALIGPNGAGKTTLFNIIAGVYPSDQGNVSFMGECIDPLPIHQRVGVGIARTFQLAKLFGKMTVLENVMVGRHTRAKAGTLLPILLHLSRVRKEEAEVYKDSMAILKLVGIEKRAREIACNLPHGEQRLLEMARALATEPKLLLLDEPAAGLNPNEEERLKEVLQSIIRAGATILLVEHDMHVVMEVSDWVNVLDLGCKIAEGKPKEIGKNPAVIKAYLGKEI